VSDAAPPEGGGAGLRVSVVVPTWRRPALLERCLRALCRQDLDPRRYEVVVADDGPDADTLAAVRRVLHDCGGRRILRYIPVPDTQGPAAARNVGWRAARGEIIAFTDDDTIPEPSWLRQGLAAIGPDQVAAAGRVRVPLRARPTDYERDAAGLERAEFVTANCFVRREALRELGGFDERFTAAWREDSDLQFRLIERYGEHCIARTALATVEHPVRPAGFAVSLRQVRKSMFDALLYKKHPRLYRSRIAPPIWRYYAIVAALLAVVTLELAGLRTAAAAALLVWLVLTLRFCLLRLRGNERSARHVAEMLLTSVLLPPLSLYWRSLGALRWRVVFL